EGHGTGVAAEGHGTGVAAGEYRTGASSSIIELGSGNPLFSLDFPIGEERNIITPESECSPGSIMLSWGMAEIALNGATASIFLSSVDTEGEVIELAALELPVIEQ
ncbi:MAG: hypothetical protein KGY48_02525, partial [Wenzhouxiangellaceae bacterium]|nr:hypothetical protein [Wenzhouxiangellaceae bacterium]